MKVWIVSKTYPYEGLDCPSKVFDSFIKADKWTDENPCEDYSGYEWEITEMEIE